MLSSLVKTLRTNYVLELLFFALMLYLCCAFVHLSLDFTTWSIYTRILLAVFLFALVIFTQYVAASKKAKR